MVGIEVIKGKDVFAVATASDIDKLPMSLIRAGKFDKKIVVLEPDKKYAINSGYRFRLGKGENIYGEKVKRIM